MTASTNRDLPGDAGIGGPEQDQWLFWINGHSLDLDTGKLVSCARRFPEPIPLEPICYASTASAVAGSGTQWTPVLLGAIYELIAHVCPHQETIVSDFASPNEASQESERTILAEYLHHLWTVATLLEETGPLSAWASEESRLAEARDFYSLNTNGALAPLLALPHIRRQIGAGQDQVLKWKRKARRLFADYRRDMKRLGRRSPPAARRSKHFSLKSRP